MIAVLKQKIRPQQLEVFLNELTATGAIVYPVQWGEQSLVVTSPLSSAAVGVLDRSPLVESTIDTGSVFQLTSRCFQRKNTVIHVGDARIGDGSVAIIAGPCAVESREQVAAIAELLHGQGIRLFRGGLFKPRTSPYSFQGLGFAGLDILRELKARHRFVIVTEALSERCLKELIGTADIIQIGSRNMQNFSLLKEAGGAGIPVLLKRGLAATMDEFLLAAEYLMAHGNSRVILCERGIRTSCCHTRNTLDLSAIPYLKEQSHLPVIVDPSHGTGRSELVLPMARAAVAAGADGLLIEVHPSPADALSDGHQSLTPDLFRRLVEEVDRVAVAVGTRLTRNSPPF
ncbi:MAG TPA: 3-deoxy-7-phosphoheptulonate synthase [Acidobacteriota bacterium]|nr:3-deoxy-7-phosphoheptulonate synthase [Acidobacteriota bacterium]HQF87178.1 3-deoxy-7-phosphoheptulonate synthase [Acidobacteriota bacterium]HQG91739.1 3-deoxy-7-phosphoheptulonate synthase [Acidobacteriota bacterium]HQK88076.1 3-deoxy-7-phosphoheptulonate synthase [Acidobacteriota bacterium]